MLMKFKEFVNEMSSIPNKEEFLQWVTEFKKKYSRLDDWDWLIDQVTNDENSSDEEMKEYFLSEKKDPKTTVEMIDELISHRSAFMIYLLQFIGSEYDEDPEIFEPPYTDTYDEYPDNVQ